MSMPLSYTSIQNAKDGSPIPLRDGAPFHSTYNPVREGAQFAQLAEPSTFFIVLGLCGAYHVNALAARFPQATIIAVEQTDADIQFLRAIPAVQTALANPNVHAVAQATLAETVMQTFLPAEHDTLRILSLRAWEQTFLSEANTIRAHIQKTLADISADFSVQSYFGKIWQRNILSNLKCAAAQPRRLYTFPVQKTAAIIAAGPSLDTSWETLQANRDSFYIIATDTGRLALTRRGITCDAVVSVDAQLVSHAHFFALQPQTLCLFDVCAHTSAARTVSKTHPTIFMETGHPLAAYAATQSPLLHGQAGSGTVTIAAAACAIAAGFSRLQFFGADFAYANGKAYARGSYLDDLYNMAATRVMPAETQFSALLFRTPLQKKDSDAYTTPLLQSYEKSLTDFLTLNSFEKKADTVYVCTSPAKEHAPLVADTFDYAAFIRSYSAAIKRCFSNGIDRNARAFITLLPAIAWFKRTMPGTFAEYAQHAYAKLSDYMEHL